MIISKRTAIANHLRLAWIVGSVFLSLSLALVLVHDGLAATPTPTAGLDFVRLIPVPTWTTTGATQKSTDIISFDRSTGIMYIADRTNKGVTAIDTRFQQYLGTIPVPGCTGSGQCPSGVVVVPDVHKLVVTDRGTNIFIFDMRLPNTPPVTIPVPNIGGGTDELDYDPLNHRVYVANTVAPYMLTVVNVLTNAIKDQIPLPSNPEQPRFNPVDGFIYQMITDEDHANANPAVLRIDPTKTGAAAIVATFPLTAATVANGIDIDPVTNTAILAGSGNGSHSLIDLSNGNVLAVFPNIDGADQDQFNPNLRRWYTFGSNNNNSGVSCSADSTGAFPVAGVFAAPIFGGIATIVGAECTGRNGSSGGVDPINNDAYVAVRQFPPDPNSATTGSPGVLVFHDPTDPAQNPDDADHAEATLAPLAGFSASGNVELDLGRVHANVLGLPSVPNGSLTVMTVTTTVGIQLIYCERSGFSATCDGHLQGDPLIGGVILLATGGKPVARGSISME